VEIKVKTDGSMRQDISDSPTLTLSFLMYLALGAFQSFSLLLGTINRTLGGWGSYSLLQILFAILRLESEPRSKLCF
jgi:hypothetical protein